MARKSWPFSPLNRSIDTQLVIIAKFSKFSGGNEIFKGAKDLLMTCSCFHVRLKKVLFLISE